MRHRNPWPLQSTAHQRARAAGAESAEGFRVIWPGDIIDRKNVIQAKMVAVGADITACTALPADEQTAWQAFYTAWRQFYCRNETGTCDQPDYSVFGMGGQYDDLEVWDANVYAWQQKVSAAGCGVSDPLVAPPTPTADQANKDVGALTELVKWSALGLGGVLLLQVVSGVGLPRIFGGKGKAR